MDGLDGLGDTPIFGNLHMTLQIAIFFDGALNDRETVPAHHEKSLGMSQLGNWLPEGISMDIS